MPPDCYFYHIPKTAGMSTWQFIEWMYPAEEICPGRMWEDIIDLPAEVLSRYRAFRGHFLAWLEPYLDRKFATFTILRDPVERTISHYSHVRRAPEHPYYAEANALSLAEFSTHPRTRHMVQNYQAAYLACPTPRDPRQLAAGLTAAQLVHYKLQLSIDPVVEEHPDADTLYRQGSERLNSFIAVGITEHLDASLARIAERLGAGIPPQFTRRNVAANRPREIDDETLRIIRKHTEVDRTLYEEWSASL